MSFEFQLTTRVVVGENTVERLGEMAQALGASHVLLVTDPGLVAAGHVTRAETSLKKANIAFTLFDAIEENPTTRHVAHGTLFARKIGSIDLIIGLGGGSAMDCAKGINFLLTNGGQMEDYWGTGKASKPMLPSIGVPTTAGTGSEAQSYALISQEKTHIKMACGDKKALFKTVILDPTLLASVPREVATATGLDALSHALESYVSTAKTPFSQMLSREAWRLLSGAFATSLQNPADLRAQTDMMLGAHYAGAAIENAMLGAAHACANPLTARFGITHGLAVAVMLPAVMRFNLPEVGEAYQQLLDCTKPFEGAVRREDDALAAQFTALRALAGAPPSLERMGIPANVLSELATDAAKQWTGRFNPRSLTEVDFLELYREAF